MGLRKFVLAIAAASFTAAAIPSVSSATTPPYTPIRVVLGGCYLVAFVGFEYDDYGNSLWKYRVREIDSYTVKCKDLSNWVLALPGCEVKRARPTPWEFVVEDPNTHLTGVKWETGDDFERGVFVVKLKGQPAIGVTEIAAKAGQNVFYGEISGPVCTDPS
jgi:hypothetical protein